MARSNENLDNFLRILGTAGPISDWSLTGLKEKLIKTGAMIACHGRCVSFRGRGRLPALSGLRPG
jgi:hypothetical protein